MQQQPTTHHRPFKKPIVVKPSKLPNPPICKQHIKGPPINVREQARIYDPDEFDDAVRAITTGEEECVIVRTGFTPQCPGEAMTRYWNARSKPQFHVPVVSSFEDISLKTHGQLPGITNGMMHTYSSETHDQAYENPTIQRLMACMTGTEDYRICPERFRFNGVNKDDGYKTTHLEGPHVMQDDCKISAILGLKGRTFTYYKGSNNDPYARELFVKKNGQKSLFVQLIPEETTKWQRTTVTTTEDGQIILFADSVVHEISRLGKNTMSLFLGAYNPAQMVSEMDYYRGLSEQEANLKKKSNLSAPPLPMWMRSPGTVRQHPKEFRDLNRRESEIFGTLFNIAGSNWKSDKNTFFMFHMMAFNAYQPKLLPFMFDEKGRFNYEIITPELVADCDEFDKSYFERLPFARVTEEEIERMKSVYTGIPDNAWPLIRSWTKDPRKCDPVLAWRYGFIQDKPDVE